jgi:Cu-Zn family superoxide dismutase
MRQPYLTAVLALAYVTALAAQRPAVTGTTGSMPAAAAALMDGSGRAIGEARLQQAPHGVLLRLDLKNATPGVHGLHVHEVGRCDAPSFESAGGHFSPDRRVHGFLNPSGPHAGDLPNIFVPSSKELSIEYVMPDVTLDPGPRSLLDTNGSAIVMHADQDDHFSDPAGHAGDRLACGAIMASKK